MNKNLLEVDDRLARVGDEPIDISILRGWENTIRPTINLGFRV